jgi:uncharacterized membrane protein YidH (DUF202 family)
MRIIGVLILSFALGGCANSGIEWNWPLLDFLVSVLIAIGVGYGIWRWETFERRIERRADRQERREERKTP